jgi:nucleoside-diphosphate-sugar epimerase
MQLVPTVSGQRMLVLGGGGFAGREVCKNAVAQGYKVTSLTRRGENPEPNCELLQQVQWRSGDALDAKTVKVRALLQCPANNARPFSTPASGSCGRN